jgi:hypothetical protein
MFQTQWNYMFKKLALVATYHKPPWSRQKAPDDMVTMGMMCLASNGSQWIRWTRWLQNDTDNTGEWQKTKLKEKRTCSHLCTHSHKMSGLQANFSTLLPNISCIKLQQKWKFRTEILKLTDNCLKEPSTFWWSPNSTLQNSAVVLCRHNV